MPSEPEPLSAEEEKALRYALANPGPLAAFGYAEDELMEVIARLLATLDAARAVSPDLTGALDAAERLADAIADWYPVGTNDGPIWDAYDAFREVLAASNPVPGGETPG